MGGHVIKISHLETYSSVIQTISVRMFLNISYAHGLKIMAGDIGNYFSSTPHMENIYAVADEMFNGRIGWNNEVIKSLYGQASALRLWSLFFRYLIWSIGFLPSHADTDVR